MNGNFLTLIGNALTQMYASQAGFFLSTGVGIFWSIVTINIFLLGIDVFTGKLKEDHFVRRIGLILIVGTIMGSYTSPFIGTVSFPHLFIDEAKSLSDQLEGGSETLSQNKLDQAVSQVEQPNTGIFPTVGSVIQAAYYLLVIILIGVERLFLIIVLGASYVAIGVIVLVGPMFIPWVLFPGLEHIAWNWFSALLQYCFYQVVGGAVTFLNASILLSFFNVHPLPWAIADIPVIALEFVAVVGISVYVVCLVPRISASVIGGGGLSLLRERGI